jgi:integrase
VLLAAGVEASIRAGREALLDLRRGSPTLDELVDAYVAQYDAAPSTVAWLTYNLRVSQEAFGGRGIGDLAVHEIATWRTVLPESRRHPAHRTLRQVLQAAVRWKWIEDNAAAQVKNEQPPLGELDPFEDWDEIDGIAEELDDVGAALVVFLAGTGLRPEEAFGAEWRDVDLDGAAVTVRRRVRQG